MTRDWLWLGFLLITHSRALEQMWILNSHTRCRHPLPNNLGQIRENPVVRITQYVCTPPELFMIMIWNGGWPPKCKICYKMSVLLLMLMFTQQQHRQKNLFHSSPDTTSVNFQFHTYVVVVSNKYILCLFLCKSIYVFIYCCLYHMEEFFQRYKTFTDLLIWNKEKG